MEPVHIITGKLYWLCKGVVKVLKQFPFYMSSHSCQQPQKLSTNLYFSRLNIPDLGLETLKYRRDFRKLKWYCKVKRMNDERLPFKLLSNKWNKVKSIKRLACPCSFFEERIKSPGHSLGLKTIIKEAVDKRECEEFETALQHKSKLRMSGQYPQ